MENLSRVAEQILSQAKKRETYSTGRKSASTCCDVCKDKKFIITTDEKGQEQAKPCICKIQQDIKDRKDNSGLSHLLGKKTFKNYHTYHEYQARIKGLALDYVKDFKQGKRNSLIILGQSGMGKTHLTAAVANELLELGENVKYFTSGEIVQRLNSNKYDQESYNNEFNKVAMAGVLIIDDLFKGAITNYYNQPGIKQDHFDQIFEIINKRYNENKPMIVNSEIDVNAFTELDQATIGRLKEMATDADTGKSYLISVDKDENKNYRMN